MNMSCRILSLVLLATFSFQTAGKLIMKPRNTDAKINHSTFFNCSTDVGSTAAFWFHGKNYVYVGSAILEPYQERFSVDKTVWNGTNIYNLVIHSVQIGDAGEYRCEEDEGFGEKYSVQLVVLDNYPICGSNIELDEVIGQNTCNIEPDEVELECIVTYHGNIPPQLEWRKVGEENSAPLTASVVTSGNSFVSTLKFRGDIALNNSSYVCETKRTTLKSSSCTSKVMKILYSVNGNLRVNKTIGEEITCNANTSQSCNYKWKWLKDEDVTLESSTAVLKTRKPGLHRCEAECYMGNRFCQLFVMWAFLDEDTESSQTTNITIGLVVTVVVTIIAVCVVIFVWCIRKKKPECCAKRRSVEENELLNKERDVPISGLSVLHQELFISRRRLPYIEVYDSTTFDFKRRITVDVMKETGNIASCSINNCLYALSWYYQEQDPSILRIDPINGNLIKTWRVITGYGSLISVAGDTNVILGIFSKVTILEYTADGELIRTINLDNLHGATHAVKLNSGLFVVGCCGFKNRVCLISTKTTESNLVNEVEILKEFPAEQLDFKDILKGSDYVSIDRDGSILVSDTENDQTVLLSPNLDNPRILISKEHGLELSWRSCYDESTNRWFVADSRRVMVCRVEGETVVREMFDLNSHHDDVTLS